MMRILTLACVLLGLAAWPMHAHAAAAPVPSGTCNGFGSTNTACPATTAAFSLTATLSFTTTGAAGCVVVFVSDDGQSATAPTVSTVAMTSGAGTIGTFTKRASGATGSVLNQYGSAFLNHEEWSAAWTGGVLTAAVVTITFSATPDGSAQTGLAATGTYLNGCAFDPTAAAVTTGTVNATNGTITGTQTTTNPDDLLLATSADGGEVTSTDSATIGGNAATWLGNGAHGGNNRAIDGNVFYFGVSGAPQSGITNVITTTARTAYGYIMLNDALTADAPPGPPSCAYHGLLMMGVGC